MICSKFEISSPIVDLSVVVGYLMSILRLCEVPKLGNFRHCGMKYSTDNNTTDGFVKLLRSFGVS